MAGGKSAEGTARLCYDAETGRFICTACGQIMSYNFGFKRCPYCHRRITHSDKRQVKLPSTVARWA